ncbi:MAG: hypothetical protein JXQ75_20090 [Phycisphaerae bacterium]|nr:hypothetical protein [Phycisphaerae bacterium]
MPSRLCATTKLLTVALIVAVPLIAGCPRGQVSGTTEGPTTEELIAFYSPKSIKILPFSKPRSFDDDAIPDGIAVSLRPLDGAGDPVKAYGTFIFELYACRPASGDHRGELLRTWIQPVVDLEDQKQFWERVTATYEFQLSWEGQPIPPQQRYRLAVSFQAPGSKRLFDEYEFEFRVHRDEILNALGESE